VARNIDGLSKELQILFRKIEISTGMKGFAAFVGPEPIAGGKISCVR
jgi:hypothetical protein